MTSLSPSLSLVVQLYRRMFVCYQTKEKRGCVKQYTRSSRDFLQSIDLGILPKELISEVIRATSRFRSFISATILQIAPLWKEGSVLLELHDYRKYLYEDFQKYRKSNPQALQPVMRRVSLPLTPAILAQDIEAMVEKYYKATNDEPKR